MFFKTVLAFLATMALAGGAVFFGTQALEPGGQLNRSPDAPIPAVSGQAPLAEGGNVHSNAPAASNKNQVEEILGKIARRMPKDGDKTLEAGAAAVRGFKLPGSGPDIIELAMQQANLIETDELREQAYLDVVSYATQRKDYSRAAIALNKVRQPELRDSGRAIIAISMARHGRENDAFLMIEEVETSALRDIMRLQVIEAMIAPERLPSEVLK